MLIVAIYLQKMCLECLFYFGLNRFIVALLHVKLDSL